MADWRRNIRTSWSLAVIVGVTLVTCLSGRDGRAQPARSALQSPRVQTISARRTATISPVAHAEAPQLHFDGQASGGEVVAPPPGVPNGRPMSLADFEQLAAANSPALAEASARVASTSGRWVQAGLYPNPLVGYSGQQLGSGGQAEQHGVLIEQEFVTARKLQKAREAAGWDVQRAQAELEAARLRVITDVRVGFYDTLFAERRRMVASDLVAINQRVVNSAQQLFDAGEVGRADVLRAKTELGVVLIDLRNVEYRLDAAWRRLAAVSGAPTLARVPLVGDTQNAARELNWDEALQSILGGSPELDAARAAVQRAAWQVRLEQARVYPNLTVQGVIQQDNGIDGTDGNLQATLPIPLFNRNQGAIREALAEQVAAEAAVDRIALRLQRQLGLVFERYASARYQADQYARELVPTARETLDLVRQGYEAGESAFIDLLTAQQTYAEVFLAYIDAQREVWVATAEIDGMLLGDSLRGGE